MGRPRTGAVAYRHGRWVFRILLHREPPGPSGRPRYYERPVLVRGVALTGRSARDEATAHRIAANTQALYDDGTWTPKGAPSRASTETTVAAWVDTWLGRQSYTEAPVDRRRATAALAGTRLGALALGKVTPREVAAWLAVLRARPTAKGTPPAPRTVRNAADPVARALRGAVFEGHLGADPFASLPGDVRPQARDADPLARAGHRFARGELETLLSEPGTPEDRLVLYRLLALSGARIGEAVALRWGDVLPDAPLDRLRIAGQWHQRLKARAPTKTHAVREVPVHRGLAATLAAWRSRWPEWYGREPADADLIVPARAHRARVSLGGPRRQAAVWRELQRDLEAAGLRAHRIHDLRHTFVSLCADAGMAADVVSRWTHAPLATSSARHLYLVPSWARQCAEMERLEVMLAPLAVSVPESLPRHG